MDFCEHGAVCGVAQTDYAEHDAGAVDSWQPNPWKRNSAGLVCGTGGSSSHGAVSGVYVKGSFGALPNNEQGRPAFYFSWLYV